MIRFLNVYYPTRTIVLLLCEAGIVSGCFLAATYLMMAPPDAYIALAYEHGLIKIACRDIDAQEPLTEPQKPVGVPRETEDLQGITCLANLSEGHVLALQVDGDRRHLRTLKTASL